MNVRAAALLLAVAPGVAACADDPVAPAPQPMHPQVASQQQGPAQRPLGTGLVLESLTGVRLPLIGEVGEVVIDQAVITSFGLVEDVAGAIIGLEAQGVLTLTGGVLGTDVVMEDFDTAVGVTSSGSGRCEVVSIDLAPITLTALDLVEVDVPEAEVVARGSGAVGALLCTVGRLLSGLTGALSGLTGLVNALNGLI